jgi:glutathione S-transferase
MVLKLYGGPGPRSTCTQCVAIVLHEKNIPYELISVDLSKGEHKAPAFVANQPFGQIPYLVRHSHLPYFIFPFSMLGSYASRMTTV